MPSNLSVKTNHSDIQHLLLVGYGRLPQTEISNSSYQN